MSETLIYQADNQLVEVRLEGETVWLRQEQLATLFGRDRTVIGRHIRNVFVEGELEKASNVQNLHIANSDFETNTRELEAGEPAHPSRGLAALALLVAESDPAQKDSLIRLIMNMLAGPAEGVQA